MVPEWRRPFLFVTPGDTRPALPCPRCGAREYRQCGTVVDDPRYECYACYHGGSGYDVYSPPKPLPVT